MSAQLYNDRYEPLALAGRGAQGEVWLAHDRRHDRKVALKIRNVGDGASEELLGEARTLLGMRPHEGLPLVRDDFYEGDRYVLVMDWIEGTNLATAPPSSFEDVLDHLETVARALDHLHGHEPAIVHCDVKPQNIVLTPEGKTVLVDLGIAGASAAPYRVTPAYVAPEVAAGSAPTPAADVFSLAVTAYVLLAGELPEAGRQADWASVPNESREHVRLALDRALSFAPEDRPRSAGAFVEALRPVPAPTNVPAALSSFIGRAPAVAELRGLLRSERLITLTGPGGCGKTRLALHAADAVRGSHPGGVWLAELAGVVEPTLVPSRIAVAVGVRTDETRDVLGSLVAFLGNATQLLVLDNCEHVKSEVARLVDALLHACPRLTILATSREPLHTSGEAVWPVPPLGDHEARALFLDRAPPGVSFAPEQDAIVADICHRLDGIPLAIELAAARLGSMAIGDLADALRAALGVLTGGARTNPRQETMRATIDWSHNLLSAAEQAAMHRLSVFVGGFNRDAADDVCNAGVFLDRLAETSLVGTNADRFRMLETVRLFAADKLAVDGDLGFVRTEHARWCAELVERRTWGSWPPQMWLEQLEIEHDNLDAALSYATAADARTAARIAIAAAPYWRTRGHWTEGRSWIDRSLAALGPSDRSLRAKLLKAQGDLARLQGDLPDARASLEEAVTLNKQLGDSTELAASLNSLGIVAQDLGELASAHERFTETIAIHRARGNDSGAADTLHNLARLHYVRGEQNEAMRLLEQVAEIRRGTKEDEALGSTLVGIASLLRESGDRANARRCLNEALGLVVENDYERLHVLLELGELDLEEGMSVGAEQNATAALDIARHLGAKGEVGAALELLAELARSQGDLEQARDLHADALTVRRELANPRDIALSLERIGVLAVERGDAIAGVRAFGEANALREAEREEPNDADVDAAVEKARQVLGPQAFEREWELGRASALGAGDRRTQVPLQS
jgi:predicted ATPase